MKKLSLISLVMMIFLQQTSAQNLILNGSFDNEFCGYSTQINIGLTNDSTMLDTVIHIFSGPVTQTWVHQTYIFQAPISAAYLSVDVPITAIPSGFIALDNFRLEPGACAA